MVCSACPDGSTTSAAGATSVDQCICQEGRFLSLAADGGTVTCTRCKDALEFSTTLEVGATSVEACSCLEGYYLESNATSRTCVACDTTVMDCSIPGITVATMPIRSGAWRMSNDTTRVYSCFNPGACDPAVTTADNATRRRRLDTAAQGGSSTAGDALCAPGHTGFLCGTCAPDWCAAARKRSW